MKLSVVKMQDCLVMGKWYQIIVENNGHKKVYIDPFKDEAQANRLANEFERLISDAYSFGENWISEENA